MYPAVWLVINVHYRLLEMKMDIIRVETLSGKSLRNDKLPITVPNINIWKYENTYFVLI